MKIQLIDGWKRLWKAWTIQLAAIGIVLPDALQLIADNTSTLAWLDDGYKSGIRLACLVLIVLLRPVKQVSVTPPKDPV